MKKWFALLAWCALGACGDPLTCVDIGYDDTFTLVFADEDWTPRRYRIEIRYQDRGRPHHFACEVSVPRFAVAGALDGGLAMLDLGEAGVDDAFTSSSLVSTPCDVLQSPANTSWDARVILGRTLLITLPGTPPTAHVTVAHEDARVVEGDFPLTYRMHYLQKYRECGGPTTGVARIALADQPEE